MERYLEQYGITRLDNPNRPLAVVGMHSKETYGVGDLQYKRDNQFKIYEVNKHYGLSLLEFLSLPRDRVENIINTLREDHVRMQKMRQKAERDANRDTSPGKAGKTDAQGIFIPHLPT